jgi:putative FmdB family regulatory protein
MRARAASWQGRQRLSLSVAARGHGFWPAHCSHPGQAQWSPCAITAPPFAGNCLPDRPSSVHRIRWSRAGRVLHFAPMPIYEFVCESCGRIVERLQKLSDPPPEACPECGGKMAKIMSRNSFQLKGGGWYRDLYSSSGSAGSASGDGKAAPKESAAKETKTAEAAPAASPPASTTPAKKD